MTSYLNTTDERKITVLASRVSLEIDLLPHYIVPLWNLRRSSRATPQRGPSSHAPGRP